MAMPMPKDLVPVFVEAVAIRSDIVNQLIPEVKIN
jgi:hypothetical protein